MKIAEIVAIVGTILVFALFFCTVSPRDSDIAYQLKEINETLSHGDR